MIDEKELLETQSPSMAKIATATVIAAAVAAVILVVAVLPAEYGIDPLGTGKALGLMELANATEKPPAAPQPVTAASPEPVGDTANAATIVPVLRAAAKAGDAPTVSGTFIEHPNRYKIDSREIKLAPGEGMEIKYHMQKGAGLIYSWKATGNVIFEFHGEPDQKPAGAIDDYYESYENETAGGDSSNGTFIAPSTGIHGWFWDNESSTPVTVNLVSAGFYDYIMQNLDDVKTRLEAKDPK